MLMNIVDMLYEDGATVPIFTHSPIIEGSSEGSSEDAKRNTISSVCATAHSLSSTSTKHWSTDHGDHVSSNNSPATANGMVRQPAAQSAASSVHHVIDASPCATPLLAAGGMAEPPTAAMTTPVSVNPYDEGVLADFLTRVQPPLDQRPGYDMSMKNVPGFSGLKFVNLGMFPCLLSVCFSLSLCVLSQAAMSPPCMSNFVTPVYFV